MFLGGKTMTELFKFPHTYHLFDSGGSLSRGDKLLPATEAELFYRNRLVMEEKVDGANIGFSLSDDGTIRVQNRGNFVEANSHPQFALLDQWISLHEDALWELLVDGNILFGEWCYARHSIGYDRLPDWFLAFDLYDRQQGTFLSREQRHAKLQGTEIAEVPFLAEGVFTRSEVEKFLTAPSALYDGPVEGVVLRQDHSEGFLVRRAKVVRPDFIQAIGEHWSKGKLVPNRLQSFY